MHNCRVAVSIYCVLLCQEIILITVWEDGYGGDNEDDVDDDDDDDENLIVWKTKALSNLVSVYRGDILLIDKPAN